MNLKRIFTILLILGAITAEAQIYKSGGIRGFNGGNTRLGSNGGRGSSSFNDGNKSFSIGGIYKVLSDDVSTATNLGGYGLQSDVYFRKFGVKAQFLTYKINDVNLNQLRVFINRRQSFAKILYFDAGAGVNLVMTDIEDANETQMIGSMNIGANINLGGTFLFLESGFEFEPNQASVGGATTQLQTSDVYNQFRWSGVVLGLRFPM